MNTETGRDYHARRAEQHLQLASRADQVGVKAKHLDMASRHATLSSLCSEAHVAPDLAVITPSEDLRARRDAALFEALGVLIAHIRRRSNKVALRSDVD